MKATGIVRKVDELGRMVIPIELRNTMDIKEKDPIEIYVEDDSIILKKYEPDCTFCGSTENTVEVKERIICEDCLEDLSQENQED
ncbi:transcriptional regulator, AbrB family [Halarsenatibacter silvermanii]|uniref:Transcriptional regulator, AbrB family n=2 Tax=Halarsenatibacter silvermanii TaxID=321763 RepID=A0A1G9K196_9FIRM|nr:AbrB/MazE/SpoVT family DNA-binding domain-containing protein [Halarsenatibacter silvermanii]SDL43216.1 transcriptional regulator, AbrB family [Halarsenatibacter silvermanii]